MDKKIKIEIAKYWLETQNFMKLPPHLEGKFIEEDLIKIFLEIRPSKLGNTDLSTISNADLVDYIDKLQSMLHKEAEISLTQRQLSILEEQNKIQNEQKEIQNKQNEIISDQTKILSSTLIVYTLMAFTMFIQLVASFYYNRRTTEGFDQIFAGLFIILTAVIFTIFYNSVNKTLKLSMGLGDKIAFILVVVVFLIIIGLYIFTLTHTDKNSDNTKNKLSILNESTNISHSVIIESKRVNTTSSNASNVKRQNKSITNLNIT